MNLPLLKYDITTILRSQKPAIHSRNMQSGLVTCLLEISQLDNAWTHWFLRSAAE